MSDIVIAAENLSKSYLVGHQSAQRESYIALRDVLAREARNFARKGLDFIRGRQIVQGDEVEEFWALRDVSFEVRRGEVLGIIGRNGAGKTTLLKILSRITEPTEGRVTLRGRVASLLEVGTGFHPELSGRENIFLNGAILGMSRKEVRRKFDDIVAFAEVERFLDTPVKRYSSGMYVRLAFAVAAHLEPELLVVDEVLAVGDAEFQRKCLGKMDDVSKREGRTVLFVSHNMGMVTKLCSSAIWLDNGSVRQHGFTADVIDGYMANRVCSIDRVVHLNSCPRPVGINDERVCIESLEWLCDLPLKNGEPAKARITFRVRSSITEFSIGIGFSKFEGERILTYVSDHQKTAARFDIVQPGIYSIDLEICSVPLQMEDYNVTIFCRSGDSHLLDHVPNCFRVEVVAGPRTPKSIINRFPGVRLRSVWSLNA
jgi:lipopolysaccharide transport system ATP-binding protein